MQGSDAERGMLKYDLSKLARKDLENIAEYGDEIFGSIRSNQYCDELEQRFALITKRPLQYPAVDYIRKGYRRSVCGVHSIYFYIQNDTVKIVRVLGRQDLTEAFVRNKST